MFTYDAAVTPPWQPQAPAPIRIDFAKSGLRALIVGLPLLGILTALFVMVTVAHDSPVGVRLIGGFFTLVFGGLFFTMLATATKALRPHGIAIDHQGVWFWGPAVNTVIGWGDIHAVGVGYKVSAAPGLYNAAVQPRRGHALEIYSAGRPLDQVTPALRAAQEQPPYPNLPPVRYRMILPGGAGTTARVEAAVCGFAPQRWAGVYQRAWHRSPRA